MENEEQKAEAPAPHAKKPLDNRRRFGVGFAIALGVASVASVASAYVLPPTHPFTRQVASALPLPAVLVGSDAVTIKDFLIERDALEKYFSNNPQAAAPANEHDLDLQVIDTLVNKKALEALADERGITPDPAKADELEAQMRGGGDQAAFEAQIMTQFGWTPAQFRERVVNSLVLATAMTEAVNSDAELQKPSREAADAALARLTAGEDFATVAKEASKDPSSATGGDIGLQPLASLPEDIKTQIAPLKDGEHTGVIESPEAFLLIQVNERKGKGDDEEVGLSVIVLPKKSLQEVVDEYLANTRVVRLIARE